MSTTDHRILESRHAPREQRRGSRLASYLRLLIRRSLVRAQVGEPISTGLAAMQGPFPFGPILERYWRLSNIQWFAAAFLVGCGGGGDPVAEPAKGATCAPLAQVRIQLFGDSTMAGYDGSTPGALAVHTPAIALQAVLDARFGRGSTLVTNRGVGGTTATELVAGTDGLNAAWPGSVAADIVVVNHGINDLTHTGDAVVGPEHAGDLALYRKSLRAIASSTAGAQLVFETPNAVQVFDDAPYAQAMREIAAEFGVPVADTNALPMSVTLLGDWAHPTDAGYLNIVAQSLAPAIEPLVARMLCR